MTLKEIVSFLVFWVVAVICKFLWDNRPRNLRP